MEGTNLSSKDIKKWKKEIKTLIQNQLIPSLRNATNYANTLKGLTSTKKKDEDNLSYRFNDFAKLTDKAADQLTKFSNNLDTAIESYLMRAQAEETQAAQQAKKDLDEFAEEADNIGKLKM